MSKNLCTTSKVAQYNGRPALFVNEKPVPAAMVYSRAEYQAGFAGAGLHIQNVDMWQTKWWTGPDEYDLDLVDLIMEGYLEADPNVLFLPRIATGFAEADWWRECFPEELSVTRLIETGEFRQRLGKDASHPGSSHSFASEKWLSMTSKALDTLIRHFEKSYYKDHMLGYHLGGGISTEWFGWNTFHPELVEDYSPAMVARFRSWLKDRYGSTEALRAAWGDPSADLRTVTVPDPKTVIGRDGAYLRNNVPAADYLQCFSETTVAAVERITKAAKEASDYKKVVGVFFGYAWSHWNITSPARSGHVAMEKLFDLPTVDYIISPYHYDNRGVGGYNGPQTLPDSIAARGKLYLNEIDSVTHIANIKGKLWFQYVEAPRDAKGTVDLLARDFASTAQDRGGYWWMDLTLKGWFDDPGILKGLEKLRDIDAALLEREWQNKSDVAVVFSPESCLRQRLLSPIPHWYLSVFRQWSLSKMGAPFDTVLMNDVLSGKISGYKLYVFPQAYYLTDSERKKLRGILEAENASALWFHAPGYVSDTGSGTDRSSELTGIKLKELDRPGMTVTVSAASDPLLYGVRPGSVYGVGCDLKRVAKRTEGSEVIEVPDPVVVSDDTKAVMLGSMDGSNLAGLVVKRTGSRADVFSFAPAPPWQFMRNLVQEAGGHVWCKTGDVIYADGRFVAIHATTSGRKTIRLPDPAKATDLMTGRVLGDGVSTLKLDMKRGETLLIATEY